MYSYHANEIPSFLPSFTHSYIHVSICNIHSFIHLSGYSVVYSFVHLLVYFIFHSSFMQLCVRSFLSFLHLCLNNWKLCNTTIKRDNMLVCIDIMPIKFVSTCEFSPIKTSSSKQSDSRISSKLRSYILSFHINRYQRDEYTVLFCVTC